MRYAASQRVILFALLAAAGLSTGGCALSTAAAGTGLSVAYAKGNLEGVVDATPAEVMDAAEAVFDEMNASVVELESRPQESRIVGQTRFGKRIKVKAQPRGDDVSKVFVRVGTYGNQQWRQEIYQEIVAKLELES